MEHTEVYKDDFFVGFSQESALLEFLLEREDNSSWKRKQTQSIRLEALDDGDIFTTLLQESYAQNGLEDIISDTLANTRLLLKADDEIYPVRNCAIKTILDRARISGNALSRVQKPVLAQILNYCLQVSSGDALLRLSEGKVSAVHGGDETDYAVLEMPELFRRTADYLQNNFPGCTFSCGSYDHTMVTALWELSNDELTEEYRQALTSHGITFRDIKPALRLSSSDVGISGANLYPMLFTDKGRGIITLGSPLKLEHKAGATVEKFDGQLAMIYSQYTKALANLTELLDIVIDNPANCMAGVMKRIGVPKKLAFEAIELFKAQNGTGACTAHDVYCGICTVIFSLQCSSESGSRVAQMEETVARALSVRWSDYDIPGETQW